MHKMNRRVQRHVASLVLLVALPALWGCAAQRLPVSDANHSDPVAGDVLTIKLPGRATMQFVWIQPGTFKMGSPESAPGHRSNEVPQHEVTISRGFWLGKYEITQLQWFALMGTTPWSGASYVRSNADNPAVYISWDDVQKLIRCLNTNVGSSVYRLPTEAEWEYACRAGTATEWSFGDAAGELGHYAWHRDNTWNVGLRYAQSVGTKRPNPWGLFDMHGNVSEWVQDRWLRSYPSEDLVDPQGALLGHSRANRGGSFYYDAMYARSARRDYSPADFRHRTIGARLLRTESPFYPLKGGV